MEFLSLDTLEEANYFLDMCLKNPIPFEQFTHIGGVTLLGKSLDKWYWVNSGKRIDYSMKFLPGQPDFYASLEFCLALEKRPESFYFVDIYCQGLYEAKFICQKNEYWIKFLFNIGKIMNKFGFGSSVFFV